MGVGQGQVTTLGQRLRTVYVFAVFAVFLGDVYCLLEAQEQRT